MTNSTFRLSTGQVATVRNARPDDAPALTKHFRACAGESDYLSFGVDEYDRPVDEERARIVASSRSPNRCYVVCCVDDKIVGSLVVTASSRPRRNTIRMLSADAVQKAKPTGAKGSYMKKVSLSSTMGPGVSVDIVSATGN